FVDQRPLRIVPREQQGDRPRIRPMREPRDVPERVADDRVPPIDHASEPARIDKDVRRLQIAMAERPNLNGSERGGMGVDRAGGRPPDPRARHREQGHTRGARPARSPAESQPKVWPGAKTPRPPPPGPPRPTRPRPAPRGVSVGAPPRPQAPGVAPPRSARRR